MPVPKYLKARSGGLSNTGNPVPDLRTGTRDLTKLSHGSILFEGRENKLLDAGRARMEAAADITVSLTRNTCTGPEARPGILGTKSTGRLSQVSVQRYCQHQDCIECTEVMQRWMQLSIRETTVHS